MRLQISSNVVIALTLWVILVLSYVSESHGLGNRNKFGHGKMSRGPPKRPRGSPKGHGTSPSVSPPSGSPSSPSSTPTSPSTTPPSPTPPSSAPPPRPSGLKVGFYIGLCPNKSVDIEAIIKSKVQDQFRIDPTILPAFLRMQFHDCFVHGCDASILIDGTSSEKNAGANLSVRGYEFIDTLKAFAEQLCPGFVSCADLIAIVTKEVIRLGGGPDYAVQTGRCDGLVSNVNDVNLPSPDFTSKQSVSAFAAKNFSPEEMVVLLGCHTVGISHCAFFQDRLYSGNSAFDSKMDPSLRAKLIPMCPQGKSASNFTFLDQNAASSNIVDNSFFNQIIQQRGILPVDQDLARDSATSGFVTQLAQTPGLFNTKLATVMVKLQALDVLTGNQGQIRKNCRRFN